MSIIKRNATDSEVLDIQRQAELKKDDAEAALGSDKADRSGSANLQYHKKAAEQEQTPAPTPEPTPTPTPTESDTKSETKTEEVKDQSTPPA